MIGAIEQVHYKKIPAEMVIEVCKRLYPKLLNVLDRFTAKHPGNV